MIARVLACAALAVCSCASPRSVVVGRTAEPLGRGNAEIGLSAGVAYSNGSMSLPTGSGFGGGPTAASAGASRLQFPAAEGNAALGLADWIDLNLHYSAAGLQPGARFVLSKGSPLTLSVMPEVGLGMTALAMYGETNSGSGQTVTTSLAAFTVSTILIGARVLASHDSGLYGAIGYEHQRFTLGTGALPAEPALLYHHLGLAAGYEFRRGQLRIRPEFAVSYSPVVWVANAGSEVPSTSEVIVMPSITFAIVAPAFDPRSTEPAPVAEAAK